MSSKNSEQQLQSELNVPQRSRGEVMLGVLIKLHQHHPFGKLSRRVLDSPA